jgi:hypothetical protein
MNTELPITNESTDDAFIVAHIVVTAPKIARRVAHWYLPDLVEARIAELSHARAREAGDRVTLHAA